VVRNGKAPHQEQLRVARGASVFLALLAITLGLVFKGQNVAFMVGLAFALAASGNFPALLLSIFWRGFTTAGAVTAILTGTGLAVVLIAGSPTIQIDILRHEHAWFPLKNPALVSMPLAFVAAILVSLLAPEKAAQDGYAAK
jgi:cation/acetate symporter